MPTSTPNATIVSRDTYTSALTHSPTFGREIRLDPAATQGVATQWFSLSAFDDGNEELAHAYSTYERDEFRRLAETVLGGWLGDLCSIAEQASWSGSQPEALLRLVRHQLWPRLERLTDEALDDIHAAISAGHRPWLIAAQRQLRELQIATNDLSVRSIQDLMEAIGAEEGDDAVVAALDVSYQHIWKERYQLWLQLSGHERLALSCEGMRAHYGGPDRRGDFEVIEREDDYLMAFNPCGTGQVMRRGDDPREPIVYLGDPTRGRTTQPADSNQDVVGMPYYCTHCPVLLEHFPLRDLGQILRPVLFNIDPAVPCKWIVPKH